ncbi:MAG: hypothetical protein KIS88_10650 [Anaerolineales bacterium]|nr:hypothetical protein [Anaerolineales bacterium]
MENLDRVRDLVNSGKRKQAWDLLNQALASNPRNEDAWILAYELAKPDVRENIAQKALTYLPNSSKLAELAHGISFETRRKIEPPLSSLSHEPKGALSKRLALRGYKSPAPAFATPVSQQQGDRSSPNPKLSPGCAWAVVILIALCFISSLINSGTTSKPVATPRSVTISSSVSAAGEQEKAAALSYVQNYRGYVGEPKRDVIYWLQSFSKWTGIASKQMGGLSEKQATTIMYDFISISMAPANMLNGSIPPTRVW